jgi:hypothetical protein
MPDLNTLYAAVMTVSLDTLVPGLPYLILYVKEIATQYKSKVWPYVPPCPIRRVGYKWGLTASPIHIPFLHSIYSTKALSLISILRAKRTIKSSKC